MEATGSNPVEPTRMTETSETNKQLPPPEGKPSGPNHPFVKGRTLRIREPIIMSVDNGKRKVEIFPTEDPKEDFIALDTATGDRVQLTEESDITSALDRLHTNTFGIPRKK